MSDQPLTPDSTAEAVATAPAIDERAIGLLTLRFLDTWRFWVKRRVESVTFPDVATVQRRISVDFEIPHDLMTAAAHVLAPLPDVADPSVQEHADSREHPSANSSQTVVLVPLTVMKKQGLTRFSLRDESGHALPLLTRDQTVAVATATLVTYAQALRDERAPSLTGDLPPELRKEFNQIATFPPEPAMTVYGGLTETQPDDSLACRDWRDLLRGSEEFKAVARDLAVNFLLLTEIIAEPHRRRIIKFSYEHPLLRSGSKEARTIRERLRRFRRIIGWGAYPEKIDLPAVGQGRCFHLEVEAPEGIQVTRAEIKSKPETELERPLIPYPNFPDVVRFGLQRVHLHVSAPPSSHGHAVVYMRPRPGTIVRAAAITAALTTALLCVVAARPASFQSNLGSAAALLLIVPGAMSAYVARPREPHVATQMLFGLRMLALSSGLWAFLTAGTLVVGRTCKQQANAETVCTYSSATGTVVGIWALCSAVTLVVLLWSLRAVKNPKEKQNSKDKQGQARY